MSDDITRPPLSQDTPPHPWTPPPQFGSDASRSGLTVDVGTAGSGSGSAPGPTQPSQTRQQWAGRRWDGKGRQYHGSPLLGPIFLISAGVIFLLNNMGVLPWSIWGQLWRLWPLALIAIGLDMLLGRRNPLLSLLIVVGVMAGGIGLIYSSGGFEPGKLVSSPLNVPLASDIRGVDVSVDTGTSVLVIDGNAGGEQLASGAIEYYDKEKEPEQKVSRDGDRMVINLNHHADGPFSWFGSGGAKNPRWELHLAREIPVTLKVDVGTGSSNLNLSNVRLERLEVDAGTGNIEVQMPSPSGTVPLIVDAGTGRLVITLPEGVQARIKVDTGTGSTAIPTRFQKQGEDTYISSGYATASNKLEIDLEMGTGDVEIK